MERFPRIEALRRQFLSSPNPSWRSQEGELLFLRSWARNRETSRAVRAARAKADMFRFQTPNIWEGELVVGKPCWRTLTEEEQTEYDQLKAAQQMDASSPGQASHMAVDYEKLLRLGCEGVLDEIRRYRAGLDITARPADIDKADFYEACEIVLKGFMDMAANYAACCRTLAGSASPERAAELLLMADNLDVVPRHPAQTFRQAVQAVHLLTWAMEGLYQLGRPDRYLYPYYLRDKQAGILTDRDALEWLDCLCLMYDEYVPKGLASGFMICGRDKYGRDVTNELSYLFLETIDHVRLAYPGVSVCWNPDTPSAILHRAVELLGKGYSHPPIFNDDLIIRGLRSYGVPADEACEYVQSTCVEITVCKSSTAWVASPYVNLVAPLLDELREGDAPDFASFKARYFERLRARLTSDVEEQNRCQYRRWREGDDALVSCFVNDCLREGRDLNRGGGRYRHIMPSFVGMANLIDSFTTVRELVYDEGRFTLRELSEIVGSDFEGREPLRQEILHRLPKYGNDDDRADALAIEVSGWIADTCASFATFTGARIIPSMFCWIMHNELGVQTGATPDGRQAGFPLGDGSGPAQGREAHGATASVLSSTKWCHERFIGGIAVNLKFGKSMFTEESVPKLEALVHTYLERGGFEVQVNVVDRDTLLKAQAHPEEYEDLVVRIDGYSDYFVHLPLTMQREVLLRTEHEL